MRLRHVALTGLLGLTLAGAPMFTSVVRADDSTAPAPKHQHKGPIEHIQAVLDKMDLSADQKSKITPLMSDAQAKVKAAIKEAAGDRDAARKAVSPIIKDLVASIVPILTSDQQEELKKAMQHHKPTTKPAN